MDKQRNSKEPKQAPQKQGPNRARGLSGRGAAAALEALKKLERERPKREEPNFGF